MNRLTIDDLQKFFLELEIKYDLLHREFSGILIWQSVRTFLYYRLSNRLGILEEQQTIKDSISDRLWAFPSFIISSIFHNPLLFPEKRDVLVFDHSRKVLVDGRYIDIYTHYLIEELSREGLDLEVFEEQHHNRHLTEKSKNQKTYGFYPDMFSALCKNFPNALFS